jgi:hypothetical protein
MSDLAGKADEVFSELLEETNQLNTRAANINTRVVAVTDAVKAIGCVSRVLPTVSVPALVLIYIRFWVFPLHWFFFFAVWSRLCWILLSFEFFVAIGPRRRLACCSPAS